MIPGGLLCVVEVTVALLCTSLPTYRPLFRHLVSSIKGSSSHSNSYGASHHFTRDKPVKTRITANTDGRYSHQKGINVTENISMTAHKYVDGKWAPMIEEDDEVMLWTGLKDQGTPSTRSDNNSTSNLQGL